MVTRTGQIIFFSPLITLLEPLHPGSVYFDLSSRYVLSLTEVGAVKFLVGEAESKPFVVLLLTEHGAFESDERKCHVL